MALGTGAIAGAFYEREPMPKPKRIEIWDDFASVEKPTQEQELRREEFAQMLREKYKVAVDYGIGKSRTVWAVGIRPR